MNIDIRSNAIAKDYYKTILDKTIREIFSVISEVYGPCAENIFMNINNSSPYHTRDGHVCLTNLAFDNPIAEDIRKIFLQAVERQAREAGDGTTTSTLFYAIMAHNLMELKKDNQFPAIRLRNAYVECIAELEEELKKVAVPVKADSDEILQLIFTSIQEPALAEKVFSIISTSDKDAMLDVRADDDIDGVEIEHHTAAKVEGDVLFSLKKVEAVSEKSAVLYVDGIVDISSVEFIDILANTQFRIGDVQGLSTIFILCADISESTKKTIKEFLSIYPFENNVVFYKIRDYRGWKPAFKNDLCLSVYGCEISGIVQPMVFEANIAKVLTSDEYYAEHYGKLELPIEHYDILSKVFLSAGYPVKVSLENGLTMDRELPEGAALQLKGLKDSLRNVNSPFHELEIKERIRRIYGNFVVVKIGSKMLKDRQRESELILDGIISSQRAIENGIMPINGILALASIALNKFESCEDDAKCAIFNTINMTANWLMAILINKAVGVDVHIEPSMNAVKMLECEHLKVYNSPLNIYDIPNELLKKEIWSNIEDIENLIDSMSVHKDTVNIMGRELLTIPIEPADTILTIVKGLSVPFDLAFSNVYLTSTFMNNYI